MDEGVGKCAFFQRKTSHISKMARDTANITINHYKEVAYALSDEMIIIDLR